MRVYKPGGWKRENWPVGQGSHGNRGDVAGGSGHLRKLRLCGRTDRELVKGPAFAAVEVSCLSFDRDFDA